MGMLESGGEPDLAEKALGSEGVGELSAENLERDLSIVLEVSRQIDHSHATSPELALDRVAIAEGVG
jgi:hypothetical protein